MWNKEDDWFWEGNIQDKIKKYFEDSEYSVEISDTMAKSQGPDVLAHKAELKILLEVKGYPSDKYVSGNKKGQIKPTPQTLQAKHWFGSAIFTLMRRKRKYASYTLALAFPDYPRYRSLLSEVAESLESLNFRMYFVSKRGLVERVL